MGSRRPDGDSLAWSYVRFAIRAVGFTAATCLALGLSALVLYVVVSALEPHTSTTLVRSVVGLATFVGTVATAAYLLLLADRKYDRDDDEG